MKRAKFSVGARKELKKTRPKKKSDTGPLGGDQKKDSANQKGLRCGIRKRRGF